VTSPSLIPIYELGILIPSNFAGLRDVNSTADSNPTRLK
jgi:hypothetical protein